MSAPQDTIIVIAWPETPVIKVDMWYDIPLKWMGMHKNDYYRAGHAAAILVEFKTGRLRYFDFGRYHTPTKYGRVRDQQTDPELRLKTVPKFEKITGQLLNHREIIRELTSKKATHGDGKTIYSVYKGISFKDAYGYAKALQRRGAIPYGPFDLNGTNCSRFVAALWQAGNPDKWTRFKLNFPKTVSATPVGNVKVAHKLFRFQDHENVNQPDYTFVAKRNSDRTIQRPTLPSSVPENAKWVSGEGAGSWFCVENVGEGYFLVERFSPAGTVEFSGYFKPWKKMTYDADLSQMRIGYISHAVQVLLIHKTNPGIYHVLMAEEVVEPVLV